MSTRAISDLPAPASPDSAMRGTAGLILPAGLVGVSFALIDQQLQGAVFQSHALAVNAIYLAEPVIMALIAIASCFVIFRVGRLVLPFRPAAELQRAACVMQLIGQDLLLLQSWTQADTSLTNIVRTSAIIAVFSFLILCIVMKRTPASPPTGLQAIGQLGCVILLVGLGGLFYRSVVGHGTRWAPWALHLLFQAITLVFVCLTATGESVLRNPSGHRRKATSFLALLVALLVAAGWAKRARSADGVKLDRPNVIVLTLDTLRRDHVGLYGETKATPNIDAFFEDATVFDDAQSASCWTLPSMISLFSGRYPAIEMERHDNDLRISPGVRVLAESLEAGGYATAGFSGNWLIDERTGIFHGFEETVSLNHHSKRGELFGGPLGFGELYRILRRILMPDPRFRNVSAVVLERGSRFLEDHGDESFFLWLHLMSPHDPYDPPASQVGRANSGRLPPNHFAPHDEFPLEVDMRAGRFIPTDVEKAHVRRLYRLETEQIDEQLNALFSTIDQLGLRSNTIIVLASDHGEEFWEHGDFYHGHSVHRELTEIPLMMSVPGVAGRRVGDIVSLVDVLPTLRELCGVGSGDEVDGRSLVPLFDRDAEDGRIVFGIEHRQFLYAARDKSYAYLKNELTGKEQLFDRRADPKELNDLAADRPELSEKYHGAIKDQMRTIVTRTQGGDSDRDAKDKEETLKRMKALGYL